jgi:hypothetical protein
MSELFKMVWGYLISCMIPFAMLIMFMNYKFETKAIQDFLLRQMNLDK